MKIENIQIVPITPKNGLIGFANFTIDNKLIVSSIAIYRKLNGGYRLLYPTKKHANSEQTIFHPLNYSASKEIENAIFRECKNVFEQGCKNDRYDPLGSRY